MLRLTVQERLRRDGVDDLEVARTGMRNDETVLQAIRDTVDAYQRDADKGVGTRRESPGRDRLPAWLAACSRPAR